MSNINNIYYCYAISDKGRRRAQNEDAFICEPDKGIFLVADGMGGESYGEVASQLTVEQFVKCIIPYVMDEDLTIPFEYSNNNDYFVGVVTHAVENANLAVLNYAVEHESHKGMGSTLTAVIFYNECLYTAHIGDSRLYRIRENELEQITTDHTKVQEMITKKIISPDEARNHPQRHIITRCVGRKKRLRADVFSFNFLNSDIFLICSDGLHDMVSDDEIQRIIIESENLKTAGELLIETANNNGGKDNITVVLFGRQAIDNG